MSDAMARAAQIKFNITHMIHGSSAMNVVDAVASVAVLHPAHNIMGEVSCEDI